MRKRHTWNEEFFSEWSPEMAYVLGYIYADGCMDRDKYRMRLVSKDKQILEDVKKVMSFNGELYSASNQYGSWYELHMQNKKLYASLRQLGVFPNKSLTMRFPEVPEVYLPHFIRGYFDGDGCVTERKRDRPTPGIDVDFATGSKDFAKSFHLILQDKVHPKFSLYNKRSNYYNIRGANVAAEKLYEYMYKENTICLMRKLQKFQDIWVKKNKPHLAS